MSGDEATPTVDRGPGPTASAAAVDVATARPLRRPLRWVTAVVIGVLAAMFGHMLVTNPNFQWDVVAQWFTAETVMRGLGLTLGLTAITMGIGIVLGTALAVAYMSDNWLLRGVAAAYIWLFRAIPELVQLLFWFNLAVLLPQLSLGIPFGPSFISWNTNGLITPFVAAILGFGLLESAYMAEIVRGGLLSVDRGQVEAAKALGMSGRRTFRRVVAPQAMRFIVPPTGNQVIRLVKGTSLVSVIALSDLLYAVQTVYNRTFETIPLLLVACLWYLIVNSVLFVIQSALERHYGRGTSQRGRRTGWLRRGRNVSMPQEGAA